MREKQSEVVVLAVLLPAMSLAPYLSNLDVCGPRNLSQGCSPRGRSEQSAGEHCVYRRDGREGSPVALASCASVSEAEAEEKIEVGLLSIDGRAETEKVWSEFG
jgi:hypothetical protein